MRLRGACVALCLWAGSALAGGAATEKSARSSRETPTVRAIRKVREGVVALKVTKAGASKDTIGTGVIIDETGYIVTNGHVIKSGKRVRVQLFDESMHEAEVAFEEKAHDLAVVKIKTARKLQALRLGPVSDLMGGEDVLAIGRPFGYSHTVSFLATRGLLTGA